MADREVRVALRGIPQVVSQADVELVGVHAHVQAAFHEVLWGQAPKKLHFRGSFAAVSEETTDYTDFTD